MNNIFNDFFALALVKCQDITLMLSKVITQVSMPYTCSGFEQFSSILDKAGQISPSAYVLEDCLQALCANILPNIHTIGSENNNLMQCAVSFCNVIMGNATVHDEL